MIPEQAFERLLVSADCWAAVAGEYETEPVERFFFLVLRETDQLWPKLRCRVARWG
jgi:hypothetical protein